VRTTGRVREVSPRADAVTGTFRVRVGLADPPPAMRLGATVTGRLRLGASDGFAHPRHRPDTVGRPSGGWVVDPQTTTVARREVELVRHDPGHVIVGQGARECEIVVTRPASRRLRAGQKVRVLGGAR